MSTATEKPYEKRQEKLALARKKLRKYQKVLGDGGTREGNARPLSEGYPGYSTDSLAESTTSDGRFRYSRKSSSHHQCLESQQDEDIPIRPPSSASSVCFHHDEHRSPFQRVRGGSESSESSALRSPKDQLSERQSLDPEYTDGSPNNTNELGLSPLPSARIRLHSPEDNSQMNRLASYLGSEQRQPTAKPLNDAEGLTVVVEKPSEKDAEDSVAASVSLSVPSSSIPSAKEDEGPVMSSLLTAVSNSEVGSVKSFSSNLPESSIDIVSTPTSSGTLDLQPFQAENETLKQTLQEQQMVYQQLAVQFHQLHGHYGQLHSAYAAVTEERPVANADDALRKQVQQQMQTMNVLVEEKTELQSQLRQAMEIANQKHVENEEIQGRLKANRDRVAAVDKELEAAQAGKKELELTLQKQKRELDKNRQESAQWEAKVIEMQQDRSELQARLKVKARELDRCQAELGDARKEIHMKEIYIRQLTAAGARPHLQQEQEMEIGELKEDAERLKKELEEARKAEQHWKWEAGNSRQQYENYGRQLNHKIVELSEQVEGLAVEKMGVEAKLRDVEESLTETQEQLKKASAPGDEIETAVNRVDLAELREKLAVAEDDLLKFRTSKQQLEQSLSDKTDECESVREMLKEWEGEATRLRERLEERSQCETDAVSLVEQLQNQRAAVSRAVSQNLQLKQQLVELQDKFVSMTEETMEASTRLQSSEFAAEQLKAEAAQKDEELQKMKEENENLQQRLNLVMGQSIDNAQLKENLLQLQHYNFDLNNQLEQTKHQLEESLRESEKFREKCSFLTAESQDTVASVVNEQRESHTKALEEQVKELEAEKSNWEESRAELEELRSRLTAARSESARLGTENSELHRIMEQNAEDENQNTIHVELQQALNRITTLHNENQELRESLGRLESADASEPPAGDTSRLSNDDRSSVCSEHIEQRRDVVNVESFESLRRAMEQLQDRFSKAMSQNADLADQNQQMEHLVTQLQSETDTIGEYITIYQHQRRLIRERLRDKTDSVAKLAREKEGVQKKLGQLQHLVMKVLNERGSLHAYQSTPPTHQRPPPAVSSLPPRPPRTLSQMEEDETQGLVTVSNGLPEAVVEKSEDEGVEGAEAEFESGVAEQILRLLTEMRKPELVNKLPPIDRNLHCKYCMGKLIVI